MPLLSKLSRRVWGVTSILTLLILYSRIGYCRSLVGSVHGSYPRLDISNKTKYQNFSADFWQNFKCKNQIVIKNFSKISSPYFPPLIFRSCHSYINLTHITQVVWDAISLPWLMGSNIYFIYLFITIQLQIIF